MPQRVPAAVYFGLSIGEGLVIGFSAKRLAPNMELHVSEKSEAGIVSMRLLKDGLTVGGRATVSMETGSYHVMLIGLDGKLRGGEIFP